VTAHSPTIIVGDSGYIAEAFAIASILGVDIDGLMGEAHAVTLADRLGLPVTAAAIEAQALPASCQVIVTMGRPAVRERFVGSLGSDQRALTLVHPDATVGPAVEIGPGTLVSPGARLAAALEIGAYCLIHTSAVISHDDVIGDFVTISPSATLTGGVIVHHRASIGAGATILPGISIGADAVIGAGALVTRDVDPATTVAGVPARVRAGS
jgi:sugar O-acyltransferase (sialic acid O-acetyltransferase NeuD family)